MKKYTLFYKNVVFPTQVSVYPKFDHFSKNMFFAFLDRSFCNLSFKRNSMKKD